MTPVFAFEDLFRDPTYQEVKNHLYNYRLRREAIRRNVDLSCSRILEVGSGVSPVLPALPNVVHSDISAEAMRLNVENGSAVTGIAFDAVRIPVADGSVETVVCSEVLEHIADDTAALVEIARVLRGGGRLVLTVPVHEYFFAYDDRAVGHYRRYRMAGLLEELRRCGFADFHTEIVTGLADKIGMLAATAVFALVSRGRSRRGRAGRPGWVLRALVPAYKALNWMYGSIAGAEARIIPFQLATIVLIRASRATEPVRE